MSHFKSEFFNIMLERGFYNQCTNEEGFDQYLSECEQKGTPAVGYLGSDPTGDSLHVGHIVPLMMMRWFQKCGHKPLTRRHRPHRRPFGQRQAATFFERRNTGAQH